MEVLVLLYIFALENPDSKNFLIKANHGGEIRYKSVKSTDCITGPKKNTYVLAPTGKVFFKQVSLDGTVGEVCKSN